MEKNIKVVLLVFIIIISGVFIFFYSFQSKFSLLPQLNNEKTEEQIMQALTDSIAPTTATTSLDMQESKKLIDSIAPRDYKIIKTINN